MKIGNYKALTVLIADIPLNSLIGSNLISQFDGLGVSERDRDEEIKSRWASLFFKIVSFNLVLRENRISLDFKWTWTSWPHWMALLIKIVSKETLDHCVSLLSSLVSCTHIILNYMTSFFASFISRRALLQLSLLM